MNKEKFKFNEKTFQLEKVEVSLKQKFKQLGIYMGLSISLALVVIVLSYPIVSSFVGREKDAVNEKLQLEYNDMYTRLESIDEVVDVLRIRDDSVYSEIFGVPPIADGLMVAGTGGTDKLAHLREGKNASLMLNSGKRLMELEAKISVHKSRFSKIEKLSDNRILKLQQIPAIQPIHNHNLIRTSSGFGMRIHPVYHVAKMHTGIDFTAKKGTEIFATGDGVIEEVSNDYSGYGKHVVIKHAFGYETLYAHMSGHAVKEGQKVKRGQLIGYVGNTGTSPSAHLHYEVIKDGRKINPANFFFNDLTYGEYSEMVKISSSITIPLD